MAPAGGAETKTNNRTLQHYRGYRHFVTIFKNTPNVSYLAFLSSNNM
jgi:hypothetical protein